MKDRKKRESRNKAKKQRREHIRLAAKRWLEEVLSTLGLLSGFQDLPASAQQVIIAFLPARPKVTIAPNTQSSPSIEELERIIHSQLDKRITTDNGKSLPMSDILSICYVIPPVFKSFASRSSLSQKQRADCQHATEVLQPFGEQGLVAAMESLSNAVTLYLIAHSQIDKQVLGCTLECLTYSPGKPVMQLVLDSIVPREIRVQIDGKVRPAFQCALPRGLKGIRLVECDGAAFGLESGRQYPVVLQSHALRRLQERLPGSLVEQGWINFWLLTSFDELSVVKPQDDAFLIAFKISGIRVGYLIAKVVDGNIVIITFKLVTMQGMPEGRLLREKLRLKRPDIEYWHLDKLDTFLAPDVLADEELVRVLEESGCGSLIALARRGFAHNVVGGQAAELKRFLGIPDGYHKFRGQIKLPKS